MKKITPNTTIAEILKRRPQAEEIFHRYGLHCAHCNLGSVESLEEGAKAHGLTDKEIREVSEAINNANSK